MTAVRLAQTTSICCTILASVSPAVALTQVYSGAGNIQEVFVGTESETYLRYLDLSDSLSNSSWLIRPLSEGQVVNASHNLGAHPWQVRLAGWKAAPARAEAGLLSPNASIRFNSRFPYGSNDGAIWAGRGVTLAAQLGAYAHVGPLTVKLLPIVFRSANNPFPLAPSPLPCGCGEPLYSTVVDRPQRFGSQPYHRLDPGQSSVRLDAFALSAGFGTENEAWGPSAEFPFILGNNAPGFAHLFFGTQRPLPIFIGRTHLRVIYGRLDQSDYSPVSGPKFYASRIETGRVRFASGAIATFQPRGFDGLEIGVSRFIHSIWPRSGIPSSYFRKPLQSFLKAHLAGIDQQIAGTDNQLASAFARWVFPKSGIEIYGEYGREDHNYDLRDLVQEPDHQRAYSVGLAKTMRRTSAQFDALRIEVINFQLPSLAATSRGEGGIYTHSPIRQGHTNRGQLLGADVGVGAAAASAVRCDHYSSGGRWSIFWRSDVRQETSDPTLTEGAVPQRSDVLHAFGYERLAFRRHFDVTTSFTLMRDLSRNFGDSYFNANAAIAITLPR